MKSRVLAIAALVIVAAIGVSRAMTSADLGPSAQAVPTELAKLLDSVSIVDSRPNAPGYDRDCGRGSDCVFGTAWTDNHAGPGGHNGCDTRNDILRAQMRDILIKPRSNGCSVLAGELDDPYSGTMIHFRRSRSPAIHIDHVYPLAMAWDMGAHAWPLNRRINFANDQRYLLAVSRVENEDKSDQGPGNWLVPHNPSYQCTYAALYLQAAIAYDLPITKADARAIRTTAKTCP